VTQPLKLTVEPIPVTSAGKSLSALLPRQRWRTIRKRVAAEHDHRCAICGVDPKDAPVRVRGKYAPTPTDPELLARYGEAIEGWAKEPPRRPPGRVNLECHEEWDYDDETHVQKLTGLIALCGRCHRVKHLRNAATKRGHDGQLRKGGSFHWHMAIRYPWGYAQHFALWRASNPHMYHPEDHFMWVNDCDIDTLIEHVEEAAEVCFRRSQHDWTIDFGEFADALPAG
jgi:hypothetical protein